ncbi:hypothetical protein [Janthinobacterium sp. PSPC3-1]|uniref:hypothetical protein n=1 Tax=Janthinobacterium sp. PSPC3-1 TaxID=2804653 RepID=UPI003CEF4587
MLIDTKNSVNTEMMHLKMHTQNRAKSPVFPSLLTIDKLAPHPKITMRVCKFTQESLAVTRQAWLASATELDMPVLDYEVTLDWTASHLEYETVQGDSLAYAIMNGEDTALAILEIVYTKRAGPDVGWLKMLSIKLSPEFSPAEIDGKPEKILAVVGMYTAAITGTLQLTNSHNARVVKLYGRDNNLSALLKAIKEQLETLAAEKFEVEFNGRWLVISAK